MNNGPSEWIVRHVTPDWLLRAASNQKRESAEPIQRCGLSRNGVPADQAPARARIDQAELNFFTAARAFFLELQK